MQQTDPVTVDGVSVQPAGVSAHRSDQVTADVVARLRRAGCVWAEAEAALLAAASTGSADLDRLVGALTSGKPAEDEFEERIRQDFSLIYKGFLKDHYVQKPIVAAVEGYCYAGGMEILQAFDIRVVAEHAQLAISEVQRGLFPMSASTIRLPRQIPYAVAMDMLLVGDPITGERAYEVGLASHLSRDGEALATARAVADRIAVNGPLAVRNIKASVMAALELTEADAFQRELELGMEVMASKDAKEGPRAFLEKRPPNFTGS